MKTTQRMTDEQVANYARELKTSSSKIEKALGAMIWDAIYTARNSASSAIRCLNGERGASDEQDAVIDRLIAHIQGA